jgi:hypothetical protein
VPEGRLGRDIEDGQPVEKLGAGKERVGGKRRMRRAQWVALLRWKKCTGLGS